MKWTPCPALVSCGFSLNTRIALTYLSQLPFELTRNALAGMIGLAEGETTFYPPDVRLHQTLI